MGGSVNDVGVFFSFFGELVRRGHSIVLTRGSVRRRGSRALVGRIDVEDLDPSRWSVVDEKVLGGA